MSTAMRPEAAHALVLLADGHTIAQAADATTLPVSAVRALVNGQKGWLIDEAGRVYDPGQRHGRVQLPDGIDPALLKSKRQTRATAAGGVDELLAKAGELDDKTVRTLLRKATEHLDRLRARVAEVVAQVEADKQRAADLAAAEREIQELQAKLSQARQRARELGAKPRRAPGKASPTGRSDLAEIREWAKANGYEVAPRGRIPASVIDAYNAREDGAKV